MCLEDSFKTVVISGVGLIGGSLGMALRQSKTAGRVIGTGRNPERLKKAVDLGAIDEYTEDLPGACRRADFILLCTPVSQIVRDIPAVLDAAGPDAAVADAGSVKAQIVAAAGNDPRFIGCHPMAGSNLTGVEAASAHLFDQAAWVITPTEFTSEKAFRAGEEMGRRVGAVVCAMAPADHDRAVAMISHLPHVMSSSLMRLCAAESLRSPKLPLLSAGSFADMTRVSNSSPELWRDICLTNRDAILSAIDAFAGELGNVRRIVESSSADELTRFFDEAARAKRDWKKLR